MTKFKDEYDGDGGDEGVGDGGGGVCAFVLEGKKGGDEMSTENKKLVMSDAHCGTNPPFPSFLEILCEESLKIHLFDIILGKSPLPPSLPITNYQYHTTPHQEEITNNTPIQQQYQATPRGTFKTKAATTLSRNALFVLCELVPLILFRVSLKSHCWALSGGKQ